MLEEKTIYKKRAINLDKYKYYKRKKLKKHKNKYFEAKKPYLLLKILKASVIPLGERVCQMSSNP